MKAHCNCDDEEQDPVLIETTYTKSVPKPTTTLTRNCRACWGVIEVLRS